MTQNHIVTALVGPLELEKVTFKSLHLMWMAEWGASSGLILNLSTQQWGKNTKKHSQTLSFVKVRWEKMGMKQGSDGRLTS